MIAREPHGPSSLPPGPIVGPLFRHEIAGDARIAGRIHFPGDARIDGTVRGDVRAEALLVVGPTAEVEATVRARRLVVEGHIEGDIRDCGTCEFRPGARAVGRIAARNLIVHAGAVIEGWISVGPDRA